MDIGFMPWRDRMGRLSPLKLVTFALLFVPGLWIALQLQQGWLAPKPVTEAIHQSGTWAVRLLLLSLLVTPLRMLGGWAKVLAVRRMIGVATMAYALIHVVLYVVDQHGDLIHVASEIVLRFYLTIGFVALLALIALGITSTDGMIRRLGAAAWTRLHRVTYVIGVLALWHFLLQAKLDITQPVLWCGLFMILMGYRGLRRLRRADGVIPLVLLAIVSAGGTALLEAGWYRIVNHVPFDRVLSANLDFDGPLRPAWSVLLVGLVFVILRLMRPLWSGNAPASGPRPRRATA